MIVLDRGGGKRELFGGRELGSGRNRKACALRAGDHAYGAAQLEVGRRKALVDTAARLTHERGDEVARGRGKRLEKLQLLALADFVGGGRHALGERFVLCADLKLVGPLEGGVDRDLRVGVVLCVVEGKRPHRLALGGRFGRGADVACVLGLDAHRARLRLRIARLGSGRGSLGSGLIGRRRDGDVCARGDLDFGVALHKAYHERDVRALVKRRARA